MLVWMIFFLCIIAIVVHLCMFLIQCILMAIVSFVISIVIRNIVPYVDRSCSSGLNGSDPEQMSER